MAHNVAPSLADARVDFGLGELFSLGSAAAWAVGVILYRRLGETLPPVTLGFLKNTLVLAMLLPVLAFFHGIAPPALPWRDVAISLASGFIGIAVADTLYFRALNALGAARMGIIGNFYSPFVIVFSVAFLGERLGAMQVAGFALVSAGVALIAHAPRAPAGDTVEVRLLAATASADAAAGQALPAGSLRTPPPSHPLRAALLGTLAIVLMAVAIVMVKRTLEAQPLLWVTVLRLLGAVAGLAAIAAVRGELRALRPPAQGMHWPRLVSAALVGQCLAMLLWLAGYKYTDASVAAILNETASVFILLLAWVWLKEPLTRRALAGVGLTMAGVVCMLLP